MANDPTPEFTGELPIKTFFDFSSEENFIHSCKRIHRLWVAQPNREERISLNFKVEIDNVKTPVYKILANKKFNDVITELENIVDFNKLDSEGNNILHFAILESNEFLAEALLEKFPCLLFLPNNERITPWELLEKTNLTIKEKCIKRLQAVKEEDLRKANFSDDQIKQMAFLFVKYGKLELLDILIHACPRIDFQRLVLDEENLYTAAIKAKQTAIVVMLIARKIKLNAVINIDEFECAVSEENVDIVKILAFFGGIIDRELSPKAQSLLMQPSQYDYLLLSLSITLDSDQQVNSNEEVKISVNCISTFEELKAIYQGLSNNENNNNTFINTFKSYLAYLNKHLPEKSTKLFWETHKEAIAQRLNVLYYGGGYSQQEKQKITGFYRSFHEVTLVDHIVQHYLMRGVMEEEVEALAEFDKKALEGSKIELSKDNFERLIHFPDVMRQIGMHEFANRLQASLLNTPAELLSKLNIHLNEIQQAKSIYQKHLFQQKISLVILAASAGTIAIMGISLLVVGLRYGVSHEIACADESSSKEVHPENNDPICYDESYNENKQLSLTIPGIVFIILGAFATAGSVMFLVDPGFARVFAKYVFYLLVTSPEILLNKAVTEIANLLDEADENIQNLSSYAELKTFLGNNPTPVTMNHTDELIEKGDAFKQALITSSYIPLFKKPEKFDSDRVEIIEEKTHYPVKEYSSEEEEIPLLTREERQNGNTLSLKALQAPGLVK